MYWSDLLISLSGQAFFFALQASMLSSAIELQQTRNERNLSFVPYLSLLVNCIVWTVYATMRGWFALFLPNAVGVFVGSYCSLVYHKFSRTAIPNSHIAIAVSIAVIAMILAADGAVHLVGLFGLILAAVVYASPLVAIGTVIRNRSTLSLHFPTSALLWLSALFWSLYGGLVVGDSIVLLPSLFGLFAASVQLFMFMLYGFPPVEPPTSTEGGVTRGARSVSLPRTATPGTAPVYQQLPTKETKESDSLYHELRSYQRS